MPEADQEKRTAENYEITQAVRIGGKEVVFGMDETNAEPYFCAFYTANELFYEYSDCMVGDNFAEMMKLFGERIQQQAGKVLAEQEQAAVPLAPLTPGDCFPNSYDECIEGKIVAVKTSALAPEYRTANHQLVYVTGGNGAQANARGNACFCINLYSGRQMILPSSHRSSVIKPSQPMRTADREPTGGEIPVELVRCQSLDDFPQQSGVSRTNWIALI